MPCAGVMFSSWPSVAFVEGVKSVRGSLSASRRPSGSGMPQTERERPYSFQPEPAR